MKESEIFGLIQKLLENMVKLCSLGGETKDPVFTMVIKKRQTVYHLRYWSGQLNREFLTLKDALDAIYEDFQSETAQIILQYKLVSEFKMDTSWYGEILNDI